MSASGPLVLGGHELEVVILPGVGARLHRLRAHGHDLLRTPDDPMTHAADPFFWGAYPMAPWCNRAHAGRHEIAGRVADLRANFEDGSAIHGLVATVPWRVEGDGRLRVEAGGDSVWPWRFDVSLAAAVDGTRLTLGYRLTNRSDAPMPAGLGLHPWFRSPLEIRVPAERAYGTNSESSAMPAPVDGRLDLRRAGPPAAGIDATWTDVTEPVVDLRWSEVGIEARVEADAPRLLVAVASPAATGAIAVEPQTHGPDPLRRLARHEPDAPLLLEPGGELRLVVTVTLTLARDLR